MIGKRMTSMTMMVAQPAFAGAGGIQELGFEEIAFVSGGNSPPPSPPPTPSRGDKIRDAAKKVARKIPGKRDDYILIVAAEGLAQVVDWATEED